MRSVAWVWGCVGERKREVRGRSWRMRRRSLGKG
jgi:hypothetical protein